MQEVFISSEPDFFVSVVGGYAADDEDVNVNNLKW